MRAHNASVSPSRRGYTLLLPSRARTLLLLRLPQAYPFNPTNTIPSWSVAPIAVLIPLAVFGGLHAARKLDRKTLAKLVLGLMFSCSATLALTNLIKLTVGRSRPNFVARCWQTTNLSVVAALPNGGGMPGYPVCTNPSAAEVKEGRKSFPSGHVSLTAGGLVFLSLFLLRRTSVRPPEQTNSISRVALAVTPLLLLLLIAITRVRDYWHHPGDCVGAAVIGGGIAHVCLRRVLPPPKPAQGGGGAGAPEQGEEGEGPMGMRAGLLGEP